MTKLLIVVNDAPFFFSHRLPIAIGARKAGFDVHIATPPGDGEGVGAIVREGFEWHSIPLSRSGTHPWREIVSIVELIRLYRRLKPDIVHHVTQKPTLYGTLAARVTGVPAIINAISGLGHLFLGNGFRYRVLRRIVGLAYRAVIYARNVRVIFQNSDDVRLFVENGWVKPEQVVLIRGSGVDVDQFRPMKERSNAPPIVVFASRMLITKGLREFVSSAKLLREQGESARFVLVGGLDDANPAAVSSEELQEWIDADVVEYWSRRDDMHVVLGNADIACLPSYREGMPKVLLEAAAAGLPIVTTDVPGCRDVIEDGKSGFVVPLSDVPALAEAIRTLVHSAELRSQMGHAARCRAIEFFSVDRVVDQTLRLYRSVTL